jgi:nicotinate phosphoribosyltransferase
LQLVHGFGFSASDIEFVQRVIPAADKQAFGEWLASCSSAAVQVSAMREGSFVYPRQPLLRIRGPLSVCQMLETPLLNAVNFASLMATNAALHRIVASPSKKLFEFGARRAQGTDRTNLCRLAACCQEVTPPSPCLACLSRPRWCIVGFKVQLHGWVRRHL